MEINCADASGNCFVSFRLVLSKMFLDLLVFALTDVVCDRSLVSRVEFDVNDSDTADPTL